MKKYIVRGGCVNRKYVSPQEVIKLYNVPPHECLVAWNPLSIYDTMGLSGMRSHTEHLIKLEPQQDPESYKKLPKE
jgi:hypothetical protein